MALAMLHPKCFVMTTPEVVEGRPVLVINYSPEDSADMGELFGAEPGQFGGWMLLHVHDHVPDNADLYFFEQVPDLDPAAQAIIESGVPGTYVRESEFAPFEFEPPS